MNITIKNIGKVLLGGVLLISASCSDFLKEEDPSNIAPETFFKTPQDAEAAVYGIYENLRFHGDGTGIFSANFQMLDALSGTAETETGQNSDLNNLYGFQYTGDNLHLTQWWRQLYDGIANANLAIEKIPTIPNITDADVTKWVGHAKFMRAFHYFWLVRLWGDVPLLTSPIYTWTDPNVNASRATTEAVYATIEADLLAAEAANFPMMDASGLASQAAVKALLARVYITMAGYPLNKGTAYYQKAAAKAKEIIDYANANPDKIALFTSYDYLHDQTKENTLEHIFEIQYAAGIANANYQSYFLPNNTNITASGEVGTTVPTASFLASYEAGDKRAAEKGFYFKQYYLDGGVGAPTTLNRFYIFKHFDVVANGAPPPGLPGTGNSGLNYPLIRYADVLLMYAEAQNEVGGPTAEAYAALTAIRDRAELTTPAIGTYNQATFREAVWRERWHELSYEGITWFDMLRLRKVYDDESDTFVDFVGATLSTNVTLQDKHLLLPLPAADYRNNPNLKPNNPGWQ
ncbi:MAG TPA: RagB/SusD family nutrient uptake outer membrane protein [Ohtaekwangia sp.]|uniref:RagB/SusD family nutrient uptake outer membrane protein n=1 Tax=Ohtaekwangia sp. TaxID=2066019 RepID=UPI002F91CA81